MDITFSQKLIKGKIAEVIFEEMFRISEEFTVLPIGYEYTTPELAQYQHHVQIKQVLDNIRHAPDFALISQDKSKVFLVEIKYMYELQREKIFDIAKKMNEKWNPSFLFIATKQGFYFDSCNEIIKSKGLIAKLNNNWIKEEYQKEYQKLLCEFIK